MSKEILMVVDAVSNEKGVEKGIVFEAIEAALASATRRKHGDDIEVRVAIDRETGEYVRRGEVVVEIMELATAQVGIAFENELLRRQLAGEQQHELTELQGKAAPQQVGLVAGEAIMMIVIAVLLVTNAGIPFFESFAGAAQGFTDIPGTLLLGLPYLITLLAMVLYSATGRGARIEQ